LQLAILTMVVITDDSFKYDFELLDSSSNEFKFIKKFIKITAMNAMNRNEKVLQIHKVTQKNPTSLMDNKRNNLMLFHGTNEKGVEGILKEGFKNSEKGWFGKGVYMTDCSTAAVGYSIGAQNNRIKYVFVNEVLKSETLKTFVFYNLKGNTYTKPKHQFEKHVFLASRQKTEVQYKEDDLGRRFRNVPHSEYSALNEYLADESITIPRYLIEFKDRFQRNL